LDKSVMVTRSSAMVTACWLLVSAGACEPVRPRGNEEVPPQLTFERLDFRVFKGPLLTAVGSAQRASFRRDTGDLAAEQVEVRFPATSSRGESDIHAARGSGNVKQHDFTAWGGVRAEQAGQVAVTSEARYSASDGLVRGDKPVEVRNSRLTVRGPGFILDPRDQILHIEGGAHVETSGGGR
jgi:Lipopolysaccharide-assembly, LptC-related